LQIEVRDDGQEGKEGDSQLYIYPSAPFQLYRFFCFLLLPCPEHKRVGCGDKEENVPEKGRVW
jgi:hypothetical protein